MTVPNFYTPIRKISFTLTRFPENWIQPVVDLVMTVAEVFGSEVIVEIDKDVKNDPLPESINFVE
jgi:hypothetical protein